MDKAPNASAKIWYLSLSRFLAYAFQPIVIYETEFQKHDIIKIESFNLASRSKM